MTSPTSDQPLVSIVTPTFPGREAELRRCVASVKALDWPRVQHVIVSDRNPAFNSHHSYETRLGWTRQMVAVQINETWRNPTTSASTGSYPWMIGSRLAMGEFIGFLGDDDELLPEHVSLHVAAMREHQAMFSVSKTEFRVNGVPQMVIGQADWTPIGSLDTTGIMCFKDALRHGIWNANGVNSGDHQMVQDWRNAGLHGVFIDQVTGIHHDGWAAGKSGRPDRNEL